MVYKNKKGKPMKRPSTHKGKGKYIGISEHCAKMRTNNVSECHRFRYAGDTCQHLGFDGNMHARGSNYGNIGKMTPDNCFDPIEVEQHCERVKMLRNQKYDDLPVITEINSYLVDKDKNQPLSGAELEKSSIEVKKLH